MKRFCGIKIKNNSFFEEEKEFKFFDSTNERLCIIYGKNGSGKSTISRSFYNLNINNEDIELLFHEGLKLETNNINIHVFNEDFINENFKYKKDEGLNTIIIIGEDKLNSDNLEKLESTLTDIKSTLKNSKNILNIHIKAKDSFEKKITEKLKGKKTEANEEDLYSSSGRRQIIKNIKQKDKIKKEEYTKFQNRSPNKSKNELLSDLKIKIEKYKDLKNERTKINNKAKKINLNKKINSYFILNKEFNKNEIVEDNFLNNLIIKKGNSYIKDIKDFLKENNKCSLCLQNISDNHKSHVIPILEKILKANYINEYKEKLNKLILPIIHINDYLLLEEYEVLKNNELLQNIENYFIKINNNIKSINEYILNKQNNVFMTIHISIIKQLSYTIIKNILKLNKELESLNEKITAYNYSIDNNTILKTQIKNELTELDLDLSYLETKDLIDLLKKEEEKINKTQKEIYNYNFNIKALEEEISNLESIRSNVNIAVKNINNDLKTIFLSQKRLSIKYNKVHNLYNLLSGNKSVPKNFISTGEQNIIGLSYFFNSIANNKHENKIYNNKYLLVIDDPISSFDLENRIGVVSYLKSKILEFLKGDDETKIILTTHDLQTFYDLNTVFKKEKMIITKELVNKEIRNVDQKRHEYTYLIKEIYDFASTNNTNNLGIGNIMRKVVEAFGTFLYKSDIEKLPEFVDKKYKKYFCDLQNRLILNNTSHYKDRAKRLYGIEYDNFISDDQKIITAKNILCLLYLIDKKHVLSHLKNIENIENKLNKWIKEIDTNFIN